MFHATTGKGGLFLFFLKIENFQKKQKQTLFLVAACAAKQSNEKTYFTSFYA
jgi:hypothetical protein